MEQIYRIKNMRKFEGKSLRKISKITGHDFATVKKYVEKENFNISIKEKQPRKSKLSPYKDIVTQWLKDGLNAPHKQRHTARRVYDRLAELYPDDFDVSERSVRKFVASIREELGVISDGSLPLNHPPGEAQVDFGEARFVENGVTYDGYYLNLSFPYSNAGSVQLFKSANQECLLEGMKSIFEHIGGVPTAIWFDNMSTAVKKVKEHGNRELTDGFLRFMLHYGFNSNFCNPNSGNEKGSVENKVGYHRRNFFVPIPEFNELKEYNEQLFQLCDKDSDRKHYKRSALIKDLFDDDKKELFKLPEVSFEVYTYTFAKADNYGKVKFQGKMYSSSPKLAKNNVIVKSGAYEIEILDNDYNKIVTHRRLYGDEIESMNWIPYLDLMAKRPTALKYTGLFNMLPHVLRDYFSEASYESKKEALKLLVRITEHTNIDNAIAAFEESLAYDAVDCDSIWATYCRLTSGTLPENEISLPRTVPELKKYTPDINIYDRLITSGGLR